MRIACFYPRSYAASWYTLGGIETTLKRMGHEIIVGEWPGNVVHAVDRVKEKVPTIEQLKGCDVILSVFHEYNIPWFEAVYGLDSWRKLDVPKIARFDESFSRSDLHMRERWDVFKQWADHFSFPAVQDARCYKGQYLPFGADVEMFYPRGLDKRFPVGFIGSMYAARQFYAKGLLPRLEAVGIQFFHATVGIADLTGMPAEGFAQLQTELLSRNYEWLKILFVLPTMSQLVVAKVYEAMAVGTMVMYPKLLGESADNMKAFENHEIVYYDQGDFQQNVDLVKYYLSHDLERDVIAEAGRKKVREKYRLDQMLDQLLSLVTLKENQLVASTCH